MYDVIIDVGHLFADSGATGVFSNVTYKEVDFNRYIGDEIIQELKKYNLCVGRSTGSLNDRVKFENTNGCKYFVSIHCNSGGGTGYEVLISSRGGKAEKIANETITELKSLPLKNRGVRVDTEYLKKKLTVLHQTKAPAILIECAFMDNKDDLNYLINNHKNFVNPIVNAIVKTLGVKTPIETNLCQCCYCKSKR